MIQTRQYVICYVVVVAVSVPLSLLCYVGVAMSVFFLGK